MELVSVLPSAEDEVNVACFHPLAGGGLVYGTKVRVCHLPGGCTFSFDHLGCLRYVSLLITGRKA